MGMEYMSLKMAQFIEDNFRKEKEMVMTACSLSRMDQCIVEVLPMDSLVIQF